MSVKPANHISNIFILRISESNFKPQTTSNKRIFHLTFAHVETAIKPQLRTLDLTFIVLGLVIGMGIFGTPPEVAAKSQIPLIFFLAWSMGAIVSFIGALTFAEIGSRYPAAGGFYKIFSHCYHPAFAFMVNWITVISNAASTAAVALMGAEYIAPILLGNMDQIGRAHV